MVCGCTLGVPILPPMGSYPHPCRAVRARLRGGTATWPVRGDNRYLSACQVPGVLR